MIGGFHFVVGVRAVACAIRAIETPWDDGRVDGMEKLQWWCVKMTAWIMIPVLSELFKFPSANLSSICVACTYIVILDDRH